MAANRLIKNLKEVIDELEGGDEWAYNFVTDIASKEEQLLARDPDGRLKLTDKQFLKLVEIHDRYCA